MCNQHRLTEELEHDAMSRLFELIDAEYTTGAAFKLNTWLLQHPAHRLAWARMQQIARLTAAYLRATEPGAGEEQADTLVNAIDDERRLTEERRDP